MSERAVAVVARVAAVVAVSAVAFALLQSPARHLETSASVAVLGAWHRRVFLTAATRIEIVPMTHRAFQAVVTPACSSTASLVALTCLSLLTPRHRYRRAGVALGAALAVVAGGNILRISASLLFGLLAGRSSLVLFHDWVGSAFAFAYTLGGYVVLLYLLLPKPAPTGAASAR